MSQAGARAKGCRRAGGSFRLVPEPPGGARLVRLRPELDQVFSGTPQRPVPGRAHVKVGELRRLRDDPVGFNADYWARGAPTSVGRRCSSTRRRAGAASAVTGSSTSRSWRTSSGGTPPGPLTPTNVVAAALSEAGGGAWSEVLAALLSGSWARPGAFAEPPPNDHLERWRSGSGSTGTTWCSTA